jgi:tRNA(Arg) A34 adenosine deaminase TadA
MRGDPGAMDLAIGAAAGDPRTGLVVQGFARDKELDDPTKHAEMVTVDNLLACGITAGRLTLAVTVEPCPDCIEGIDESGLIDRVVFINKREEVSNLGLIKPHGTPLEERVQQARIEDDKYHFELLHFPSRKIAAVTLELLTVFERNPITEKTEFNPAAAQVARFRNYMEAMELARENALRYPHHDSSQIDLIASHFADIL